MRMGVAVKVATELSKSATVFFFSDTATTEIYTLSLHDALPICCRARGAPGRPARWPAARAPASRSAARSEEHTSELQSRENLVCRLLLEKKNRYLAAPLNSADLA